VKGAFTALIEFENDGYVALCPELDIASQGDTIDEARHNLLEALELFFKSASMKEINGRLNPRQL
ncbi:MAG: type II toxin-antitoxin system HicB family antitoxin, partial [Desulfobaccales bacterium]